LKSESSGKVAPMSSLNLLLAAKLSTLMPKTCVPLFSKLAISD
jgi:hypothetical protein